jgi:hypothetical protein
MQLARAGHVLPEPSHDLPGFADFPLQVLDLYRNQFPDGLNFAFHLDARGIELAGGHIEAFQILAFEPADLSALLQIHKESALHLAEPDRILRKHLVLFRG